MTTQDDPPQTHSTDLAEDPRRQSATHSRSMHKRLTLSAGSNVLRYVVSLGTTFFLTPFVLRTLGNAVYGFWVVLLSFVGYAGILELGVQPAVIKLVGQRRGSQKRDELEELITAAFLFFAAAGLLAALLVAFVLPPLVPRLVKEFSTFSGLRTLLAIIAVDVVILFLNYLFAGILYGWQMYHVKNLIDISSWIINAGILVLFLTRGGLILLAASKATTDLLALLATLGWCRRALPDLRPALHRIKRDSFRELMRFGGGVFVSASTTRISTNAQPLIISSQISASATAFFAIPTRLVGYSKEIGWALSTGFMPMFSELEGRGDRASIRSLYMQYSRYILISTVPILALIFIYGREFIGLWIGREFAERGHTALYLLTAAALIEGLQPLLWRLFMGVGRLRPLVTVSASTSLLAVGMGFLLVRPMGITGVALSVLLTSSLAQALFFRQSSYYLEVSALEHFWKIQGRPLLLGAVYFGLTSAIAWVLGKGSYGAIAAGAVLSLVFYLPLAVASLLPTERQRVIAIVRARLRKERGFGQ